jgi:hypothetical protein
MPPYSQYRTLAFLNFISGTISTIMAASALFWAFSWPKALDGRVTPQS